MYRKPGAADRDDSLVLGFSKDGKERIFQILSYNTKLNHWRVCVLTGGGLKESGALDIALFRWSPSEWIQKTKYF